MTEQTHAGSHCTYERDALTLAYSVFGDGHPIVFVHGATATGEFEWRRLAGRLASGYRCILPDLRGHGFSDIGSDMRSEAICADLLHLIDHLALDKPHVVGFSYGAEAALTLELVAPGTARSLVLISPGTGRPDSYRAPDLDHLYQTWPFALRRLHETRHGPDHWRHLVTALHEDSVGRAEISADSLAGVDCPVLLMAGARDERTRREQGRRFAQVKADATYIEIEGAAHAAHHESLDKVALIIGDFLAEVESGIGKGRHGAAKGS
jgi:pimeloyl-ACP methyl ester carboxylesterase